MKNSLVTKVVYRSVFCSLSFVSLLLATGFFSVGGRPRLTFSGWDMIYYYTNLSNYLCLAVTLALLIDDIRQLRTGKLYGYNPSPLLSFLNYAATQIIALTFTAYVLCHADLRSIQFWNDIANLGYHVVCPLMFILDTLLFQEHRRMGIWDPVLSAVIPLVYVIFIEIFADFTGKYPYFFLDWQALGPAGMVRWLAYLLLFYLSFGYSLFVFDKLVRVDERWVLDFSHTPKLGFLRR